MKTYNTAHTRKIVRIHSRWGEQLSGFMIPSEINLQGCGDEPDPDPQREQLR
jgi:hypothetical protein